MGGRYLSCTIRGCCGGAPDGSRGLQRAILESLLGPWFRAVCPALFFPCDPVGPLRTLVCFRGTSPQLLPPDHLPTSCFPPDHLPTSLFPSELEAKLQIVGPLRPSGPWQGGLGGAAPCRLSLSGDREGVGRAAAPRARSAWCLQYLSR